MSSETIIDYRAPFDQGFSYFEGITLTQPGSTDRICIPGIELELACTRGSDPQQEPPLQDRFSLIPRIQIWCIESCCYP